MAGTSLVVAIDETGTFREQKLDQTATGRSGIVAVLTTWDKPRLDKHLRRLGDEHGVRYPNQFHAMELLHRDRPTGLGVRLSDHEAAELVRNLRAGMDAAVDERVGVVGPLPGRRYFHEQEAYGEMLLATLDLVRRRCKKKLEAVDDIEVIIATRAHGELTGFYEGGADPEQYHKDLVAFVRRFLRRAHWPKSTVVRTDRATKNPYLILADFQAGLMRDEPAWVAAGDEVLLPASIRAATALFRNVDEASALLLQLADGDVPNFTPPADQQRGFSILRRLTSVAHAQVADRFGAGSLEFAERLVDFTWPHAAKAGIEPIQGELCAIAAEICSHRGLPGDDGMVVKWTERAEKLPARAWASNSLTARAIRLDHRCQTVQTDHFNTFAFDEAYIEFCDIRAQYEDLVGGVEAIDVHDETYGKILGTLGQACGFLRAREPGLADDALGLLETSARYFEKAQPVFRAMSLGYRLTELWDRGDLDGCAASIDERVPPAEKADPYSLLHRLRLAAARTAAGRTVDAAPLVNRLLALTRPSETRGATPWDLCLKWALYLDPDSTELREHASAWCAALKTNSAALLATSLPLLSLVGRAHEVEASLAALHRYPGFVQHWNSNRAQPLRAAIADGEVPGFAALRAMPWNYA